MDEKEKEKLKNRIAERIEVLKKDIESYKTLTQPVSPDNAIGRLTRMDAMNSKSINEAAMDKARHSLARLEQVLKNIDSPDFGLCRECEETIPFKRLMAMPETELCVACINRMTR